MQTTFRLNAQEIDYSFFEAFKKLFKNKEVNIIVEEANPQKNLYEMYKKSEALQKKYPPREISPEIDLSALANEVNL